MTSNWITPQLKDTDQTFDPYLVGNKPQYTGFVGPDGRDARDRYSPLSFGQMAPATALIASNGSGGLGSQDLNQLFAAIGTASYLQPLILPNYTFAFDSGVTITDRLTTRAGIIFRANGTWEAWLYTTNYKTDSPGLYAPNPGSGPTNYSNGLLVTNGSWTLYNPASSPYIVFANISGLESGTANHYIFNNPAVRYENGFYANGGALDGFHTYLYRSDANYSAIPDGRWYSLSSDVTFMLIIDAQGGSNNSSFYDANNAISWYNLITYGFTIAKPGGQQVSGSAQFRNEIRWNAWNWSGGGGTGGSGGCVADTSWVTPTLQAGWSQAGDKILGMTEKGEFMPMTILSNRRMKQPCVTITMVGGASLTLSTTTPVTLRDGSPLMVTELRPGMELPVTYAKDKWIDKWEEVESVVDAPDQDVMLISVGGHCYAAGSTPDALIYTHNLEAIKQ